MHQILLWYTVTKGGSVEFSDQLQTWILLRREKTSVNFERFGYGPVLMY